MAFNLLWTRSDSLYYVINHDYVQQGFNLKLYQFKRSYVSYHNHLYDFIRNYYIHS